MNRQSGVLLTIQEFIWEEVLPLEADSLHRPLRELLSGTSEGNGLPGEAAT